MWAFLRDGGPFMFLLVVTSITGVAIIIERALALRRFKVIPPRLEEAVDRAHAPAQVGEVKNLCAVNSSALARLLIIAHENRAWPKAETIDTLQTHARGEVNQLERGLVILEVVVGIAPLLGLVGTVHGLITLFGDLGKAGLNDNTVLAKGIAIALNTTLAGLLIAIPCLVAWSYLNRKVESLTVELETISDKFIRLLYRDEIQK